MMRLFRYLCTVFNIIAYDNRTIPSDGNPLTLKSVFCLSEYKAFYLLQISKVRCVQVTEQLLHAHTSHLNNHSVTGRTL